MWNGSINTMNAIYGLLMEGEWLENSASPYIVIGKDTLAFSPYFQYVEKSFMGKEITKDLGTIAIRQESAQPGWGAVYWQYYADF